MNYLSREDLWEHIKDTVEYLDYLHTSANSPEEVEAKQAELEIQNARRRIKQLYLEIEREESVIRQSLKTIKKFKSKKQKEGSSRGKGRPERDGYAEGVALNFTSIWVSSVMEALEVTSCQKLEQLISPHSTVHTINPATGKTELTDVPSRATERNWRRWLKKEAAPNYNTLYVLLEAKVEFGKHKGKMLHELDVAFDVTYLLTILSYHNKDL